MEVEVEQMEITIGGSVAEKILDTCIGTDERRYYKVQWQPTWESEEDVLLKYHYLVEDFWKEAQMQQNSQIHQNMVEALLNKVESESSEAQMPTGAEVDITVSTVPASQPENIVDLETPLHKTIQRVNSPEHKVSESIPTKNNIPPPLLPHDREGVVHDFKCDECFRSYDTERKLKDHKRKLHTTDGAYKCSFCSKLFSTKRGLQDHLNRHTGMGPNVCPGCSKRYITVNDLEHHKRSCDGLVQKEHQCEVCKKSFTTKAHLSFHMKIHVPNEEKPYGCQYCPRRFAYNHDCVHHMRLHIGEKPFKCSDCDAAFHRKSYLTEHMFVHTGVSKYQCQECKIYFKTQQMLKTHVKNAHILKKESVEKNSESEEPESKKQKKNEKRKNKRYRCDDCNKEFRFLKEYHFHQALNHKEKIEKMGLGQQFEDFEPTMVYKCKKCDKTFPHSSYLKKHATTHKSVDKSQKPNENGEVKNADPPEHSEDLQDGNTETVNLSSLNETAASAEDEEYLNKSNINLTTVEIQGIKNEESSLAVADLIVEGNATVPQETEFILYTCPQCNEVYENEHSLITHITERHQNEIDIQNEDSETLEFTVTSPHDVDSEQLLTDTIQTLVEAATIKSEINSR